MNVTFDRALPMLVGICEQHLETLPLEAIVVVRDLRGRLRLVVHPTAPSSEEDPWASLESSLGSALGNFFAGPILDGSSSRNVEKRLAAEIRSMASEWHPRAEPDPATDEELPIRLPWLKLERRLAKEAWLSKEAPLPPWKLGEGPGIVTFFSFKGGVGRSTALASCAWQLARKGQRVAVVDLDLEGPGAGMLLGSTPDRGVIDFFADWMATDGRASIVDLRSAASGLGSDEEEEKIDVYPAGRLGLPYLEKLARLDFAAASTAEEGRSPIESAIELLPGRSDRAHHLGRRLFPGRARPSRGDLPRRIRAEL